MKPLTTACLVTLFTTQLTLAADQPLPQITVYGTAITQVAPDTLRWSLTVKNKGTDLETVAGEHSQFVSSTLTFLKDLKIESDDIQTADMRFGENWEYVNDSHVHKGYYATTDVSFSVTDFRKYREIWIGLAKKKHVSVDSVRLDVSNRIELQDDTRHKALLAARKKAKAMGKTLDCNIGAPLVIDELQSPVNSWSSSLSNTMIEVDSDGLQDAQSLAPGRIPIKIRVRVSFQLIHQG